MSEVIQRHLLTLRGFAHDFPDGAKRVRWIESKTNIAVEHLICGIEIVLTVLLFCGTGAVFITNLVGFFYPAIMSIRAIESETKEDDTHWLIYWVVFATFNLLDPFVEMVVIYWIPFFYPLKVSFLLWMMLPQTKGANVVFNMLSPYFGGLINALSHVFPAPPLDNELRKLSKESKKKA